MADRSRIEWTTATWNPVTGCDRVSAGCDNCCALALAKRLKAMGADKYQADGDPRTSGPGFAVTTHPETLDQPRRWQAPRTVFVNSMNDLSVGVSGSGHCRCLCNKAIRPPACARHVSGTSHVRSLEGAYR